MPFMGEQKKLLESHVTNLGKGHKDTAVGTDPSHKNRI
jgi:hypothetical protein